MAKLDPGLRYLAAAPAGNLVALAFESALGVEAAAAAPPRAKVLVEVEGNGAQNLVQAGFVIRTRAGNVLSGEIPIDAIPGLDNVEGLVRAEVSRVLAHELNLALPEARVIAVHTGPPGRRGAGVIIGIIDSGIDYQHPSFRHANGKTRILAIWDQRLRPQAGESSPGGFNYGVEYSDAAIDAALASATPLTQVRHVDIPDRQGNCHGTHVAGIAAGNGRPAPAAGGTQFLGVAPDADIVVVANTRGRAQNERGLGDSADTLDAVQYILNVATTAGRPVAINQSQGDNVGPHDGTSLLEVGIAGLISGPGQVLIKSAGNEGALNRHAQGTLTAGASQDLQFRVPANTTEVMIDVWYPGADRIDVRLTPPGAAATPTAVFTAPSTQNVTFSNGNAGFVDLDTLDPGNGDNRTFVVLEPGSGMTVQSGVWTLQLRGATITNGRWHAWIQRHSLAQFQPPLVNNASTISIPGTSTAVISVGSYVTNAANPGSAVGALSSFSSRGPTRDGRRAPTLSAPGEELTAAQPAPALFGGLSGTSMASPMVTGTAALMLEVNPAQTAVDIRTCLERSARLDGQTGAAAGNQWGAGKLDAQAACGCADT
jgi:subtilisin family serine protease